MPILLQIGASCNWGAPGKIAEQIGLQAQSRGWDCYIAHGARFFNPTQLNSIPVVNSFQEKLHYLKSLLFDAQGLASTSETKDFLKKVAQIKPDVIHLHNLHGYFINYNLLFKYIQEENIPVVWTFHDFWPITGHCCYFDSINCEKWKTGCYDCALKSLYPRAFLDCSKRNYGLKRKLFSSLKKMKIVTVSNWQKNLVEQSFLNEYPIETIYNGINTDVFTPCVSNIKRKYGIEEKKLLLAVALSWSERKGLHDYIKLSKVLPPNYVIMLIGIKEDMKSILPNNIISVPLLNNQIELADYYSCADATLNLSYMETFGMTTVEGMACGTPGIVYDRTASPELVSKKTGKIVSAGNIDQVVNAVLEICSREKNSYIDVCRERVLNTFDSKKQYSKYIDVYNSLHGKNL